MVELIAVILMLSALAVVVMPRLEGALSMRSDAWRDQVLGSLQHARSTAIGHRRLVCATVGAGAVTLTIASANPASACGAALPGIDGDSRWARDGGTATSVAPAGIIYFQPSGRVTSDGAGSSPATRTISIAGQDDIVLTGTTGHVR